MMKRLMVTVATTLILSSAPAVAEEEIDPYPTVKFPLATEVVQITGPKFVWGMRVFARELDAELSRVQFEFVRTCDPDVTCINVEVGNYGSSGWYGMLQWDWHPGLQDWSVMTIKLNTYYVSKAYMKKWNAWTNRGHRFYTAKHELMHAFGIDHHSMPGLLHRPQDIYPLPKWPSVYEMNLLKEYYD